ncbi:ATP-dependent protease, partial [Pseudoalteromonas sp. S2721]
MPEMGGLVHINDFNHDDRAQLYIQVSAERAESMHNANQDKQQLRHADIQLIKSPSSYVNTPNKDENSLLSDTRRAVIENQPDVAGLYKTPQFANLAWVVARWLEM